MSKGMFSRPQESDLSGKCSVVLEEARGHGLAFSYPKLELFWRLPVGRQQIRSDLLNPLHGVLLLPPQLEMLLQAGAMMLASTIQLRAASFQAARARVLSQESGVESIFRSRPSTFAGDALELDPCTLRRDCRARTFVIKSTLNTSTDPGNSEGGGGPFGFGTTRLGRIIAKRQRDFSNKFNTVRKKFPIKIFLLLLGYYSANALATILGQTGDWDVLAAGILVALIEGVGYLMYRLPSVLGVRGKELIVYVNFWKSGFSFGLFVDAFKLGS